MSTVKAQPIPALSWQDRARFWSKVDVEHKDRCWLWRGTLDANGYGVININGAAIKSHRLAYSLAFDDPVGEMCIRHACDNPPCCNPHHLLTGTQAQNMADCIARGRHAFGKRVPNAKLTDEQASAIWDMKDGGMTAIAVGRMFSISEASVRNVWYGKTWKHIHS